MAAFAVVKHRRAFVGAPELDHGILDLGPPTLLAGRLCRGPRVDFTAVDHGDTGSLLADQRGEILVPGLGRNGRGELGVCDEVSRLAWGVVVCLGSHSPLYRALQHLHSRMLPLSRARGNRNPQSPQKSQDAIRRGTMRASDMFAQEVDRP